MDPRNQEPRQGQASRFPGDAPPPAPETAADDNTATSSLSSSSSFPLFPSLPTELRLQIWRRAAEAALRSPSLCVLTARPYAQQRHPATVDTPVVRAQRAGLLGACRASREAALGVPGVRPYDLGSGGGDILYVPWAHIVTLAEHLVAVSARIRLGGRDGEGATGRHPPWVLDVRRLAVPARAVDVDRWLPYVAGTLRSLEVVIVVFPGRRPRGASDEGIGGSVEDADDDEVEVEVDVHAEAATDPGEEGIEEGLVAAVADPPALRRLTPDELRRLHVRSDYKRLAPWAKPAWKYMEDVEKSMNRCALNKLKFEACFFV